MNQNDNFDKAMREATRGVIEYVETGRAPLLSICDDGTFIAQQYRRAIEAVAEALLDWQMLDGDEVSRIIESATRASTNAPREIIAPLAGPERAHWGLLVRTSSIGGAENGAYSSYSQLQPSKRPAPRTGL